MAPINLFPNFKKKKYQKKNMLFTEPRVVLKTSGTVFSHTDLPTGKWHIFTNFLWQISLSAFPEMCKPIEVMFTYDVTYRKNLIKDNSIAPSVNK